MESCEHHQNIGPVFANDVEIPEFEVIALADGERPKGFTGLFLQPRRDREAAAIVDPGHRGATERLTQQIGLLIQAAGRGPASILHPIILLSCRRLVENDQAGRLMVTGHV